MRHRFLAWTLIAAFGAPLLPACTSAHARITPEAPLNVPPPPPRVIDSTEPEPQQPVPMPEEPAHHPPSRMPRQPKPADAPKPAEPPKPEPPKTETPPPAEAPKPPEEAPKPPPTTTLQTTSPQAEVEVEKVVRSLLARAQSDLNRVDYRGLNNDARGQYDQAKRLMSQADDALRAKNLVFAHAVADKAATLAAQLAGR